MTLTTRRSVLAAVAGSLATAGCVTDSDGTDPGETTTSERPTEATTRTSTTKTSTTRTTTDDSTTTKYSTAYASRQPDPDHRITLNNDSDEARTVRIRVVRTETGETTFADTREVPAGTEFEVYNLTAADPDGIEAFRVCGQLVDPEAHTVTTVSEESAGYDCATLRTNACYGHAHVTVQDDGSLAVIYSIC